MCRSEKKWLLFLKQSQTCSLSARTFLQRVSEQQSNRTALRSGWTRVSVPNPSRVSVIIKPAPEKPHSPQGPVAHFYKEPKMLLAFAKLFSLSVPLPVQRLHCRETCHHITPCVFMHHGTFTFSISSFKPGCPLLLLDRGCCLKEGGGCRGDI